MNAAAAIIPKKGEASQASLPALNTFWAFE